ncbi:hypothetical protein CLOSYM_00928 [[Clostridium] symbiosum ATCC 14940]|uniref:Uncharacterized protein n=1 Tax=[Clostridium] symbiosum ATCC 14940 TaxID=411472 RepID=A0ABC9U1J9_CLOSY|nr:hypothetical protein CLOSYM_00928 [[Clostridium] symbiosum ATCC 14940]
MMYSARCFRCFCKNPELCGELCAQVTVVMKKQAPKNLLS